MVIIGRKYATSERSEAYKSVLEGLKALRQIYIDFHERFREGLDVIDQALESAKNEPHQDTEPETPEPKPRSKPAEKYPANKPMLTSGEYRRQKELHPEWDTPDFLERYDCTMGQVSAFKAHVTMGTYNPPEEGKPVLTREEYLRMRSRKDKEWFLRKYNTSKIQMAAWDAVETRKSGKR